MPTVEESLRIDAPPGALFALAQDYELRLEWDPFLREMEFLGGAGRAAPGVRVRVQAWNGLSMEVEYLTVDPPSRVAMRMLRGPRCFETFAGTWRFEGEPGGGTLVTFRYGFRTRWRWLRPLLDPVAAAVLRRDVRSRLRGLARGAGRPELMERLGAD